MHEKVRPKRSSQYLILMILFLLVVTVSFGYLLMSQSRASIVSLMQTRMLDVSNTAAAMIDGDVLESVTPDDEGTDGYERIMKTLTYFQDNIDLKYIYCIRDMGDGTFTFGLDPTVEDPGEFGSPIVYTEALNTASKGTPAADEEHYEDAWGAFYSAYSPVFNSKGEVAGIIAVDFSADWYNEQIATLTRSTVIVALLALIVGGGIVVAIIGRSEKRIGFIQGQLNEMEETLLQEMGSSSAMGEGGHAPVDAGEESSSLDSLGKQIQSMSTELRTQIAHVHGQAYRDGLTGVKSKQAYLEMEQALDAKMGIGEVGTFAFVICDVNGLKMINDTLGHKAGDEHIRKACDMICDVFMHSPVYRVGGDEFVAILFGRDYENRVALMHALHKRSVAHINTQEPVVSGGMAEYVAGEDVCVRAIFERADQIMYQEKMLLKSLGAQTRGNEPNESAYDFDFDDIAALSMKRHLLIADDVDTNREILGALLEDDYEILYASDGIQTLEMLRSHKDQIALLLLDLYMPNMTGREVLAEMQVDEDLMSIPVIVVTVDEDAELDCLQIGAMDFIPKPYPDIEIVKARISQCIELSENRDLIHRTQRDRLTGLYNIEYFIRYVDRFDQTYEGAAPDAVVCDVVQFHEVIERYGRQFGDLVLRSIGMSLGRLARRIGGIGCRKEGDTFLLYCPHQDDYEQLFARFVDEVFVEEETARKVSLRFGVFVDARLEADIEERFVCARIAVDSLDADPNGVVGFYQYQGR